MPAESLNEGPVSPPPWRQRILRQGGLAQPVETVPLLAKLDKSVAKSTAKTFAMF